MSSMTDLHQTASTRRHVSAPLHLLFGLMRVAVLPLEGYTTVIVNSSVRQGGALTSQRPVLLGTPQTRRASARTVARQPRLLP